MGGIEGFERLPDWVIPLRAPNPGPMTLDGTNTWILRAPGEPDAVVVDPGPLGDGHLERIARHGPFRAILITHGHADHVEGAARLAALLGGGTPVHAADPRHGTAFGELSGAELAIDVISTPGHTADSVCFVAARGYDRVVLTGDTILGRGSTVVSWPDGELGAYLQSLGLLTAYAGVVMLPGHGPVLADCGAAARACLAHREERLAQVRAAFERGADTPAAIVDVVYPDVDPRIRYAAEASAAAQLDFLRRESQPGPEQLDPL